MNVYATGDHQISHDRLHLPRPEHRSADLQHGGKLQDEFLQHDNIRKLTRRGTRGSIQARTTNG